MIYEDVFRKLQELRVRYLVVGGVAINLYGILRATGDLDLMLELENGKNVQQFIAAIKSLGFKPRIPIPIDDFGKSAKRRQWSEKKGAMVMTFLKPNSFEQIDVFLKNPIDFAAAYKRRTKKISNGVEISVSSLKDLKRLKLSAKREKDLSDIRQIEKLEELDHEAS